MHKNAYVRKELGEKREQLHEMTTREDEEEKWKAYSQYSKLLNLTKRWKEFPKGDDGSLDWD